MNWEQQRKYFPRSRDRVKFAKDYSKSDLPRTLSRDAFKKIFRIDRKDIKRRQWWESRDCKDWKSEAGVCPHCTRDVSNGAYWGNTRAGSAHFKGTCKPETFFPVKIPRQSWKGKFTTPEQPDPNYRTAYGFSIPRGYKDSIEISNMDDFCRFWGVQNVAGSIDYTRDAAKQIAA